MRYRKTTSSLFVLCAAALVLSACGAELDETADQAVVPEDEGDDGEGLDVDAQAEGDGPLIAFVAFTQDITEMAGQQIIGLEAAFEEAGFEYTMNTAAPAGAEDHDGMDRILQDTATLAPDYAIVNPASYALVDDRIAEIEAAGTTTIVGAIDPGTLEESPDADPLTWVAVDEYAMGHNGAEFLAQGYCEAGEDITVVPFWGPAASEISQDRVGGALDALDDTLGECGLEYEVVDEVFADFNREKAFRFTETIVTAHPDVDLIIGANSNTALGVMESLTAQGRIDDIDILGNGGQLDELAAICRGDITAAGFRDAYQMGFDMAEAIMRDWEGNGEEVPEVTLSDLPVTHDCESVFDAVPMQMLEHEGFQDNIPDGTWEEFTR
ncbi:sugar ABC transporter substrate-binding protein [Phytoactinopolyspora halotolerans]|uniref:Sugar ABC transporter substrate-binding protein n=1 Tax=Phytoactinopolyspora halotolerans TaxID=1981512 RepID=A0A6L9SIC2_9ACTN|nr:sugar ABC transporter substrate-binding protein [Phytoactinopolyspora halotolerans]NEE04182.1 sugar ABC transporter substrate-binding protein [Phytoactinopolyspora halotolerans]